MPNIISDAPWWVPTFGLAALVGAITFFTAESVVWTAIAAGIGASMGLLASNYQRLAFGGAALIAAIKETLHHLNHPQDAVGPFISNTEMFPDKMKGDAVDYIRIWIGWNNHSFVNTEITNIRGSVRVDAEPPSDALPEIPDVVQKRRSATTNPQRVTVRLHGESLENVWRLRRGETRTVTIYVEVSADVNGRRGQYEFTHEVYLD